VMNSDPSMNRMTKLGKNDSINGMIVGDATKSVRRFSFIEVAPNSYLILYFDNYNSNLSVLSIFHSVSAALTSVEPTISKRLGEFYSAYLESAFLSANCKCHICGYVKF